MRKIRLTAFVSMDGVMQAPGGPDEDRDGGFEHGGWTVSYWDEPMGRFMDRTFDTPFDLLLGRRTYDIFAAHWPRVPDSDPIAKSFNTVTKYVATHRPDSLGWRNSEALTPDPAAALRDLKAGNGPDLLVQGSTVLLQTLLAGDLVDEISLLTFPLVLGKGKRLFQGGAMPGAFRLTHSQVSTSGVLLASYERSGVIVTGSFALDENG
ncbi:dihydrofolate reductase family protein [Aquamicrobium ahrensii]|uniref:Dihydrofolate reductase n=1 Tax=Aquamicrobium ahrensii TaxID=469551 RepID=A0ABV2KIQ3_9HYPH